MEEKLSKKFKGLKRIEMPAIARPKSKSEQSEWITKVTYSVFYYRQTKTGRSKIDYLEIGLAYFSIN